MRIITLRHKYFRTAFPERKETNKVNNGIVQFYNPESFKEGTPKQSPTVSLDGGGRADI